MDAPVTVINAYEMPDSALPRFIEDWRVDRGFLNARPGFVDGTLYQSVFANARYRIVTISRWRSAAEVEAAYAALRRHHAAQGFYRMATWRAQGVTVTRALYQEAARY
jgi:heme-degrading monooxygenase HmoA